jgi:hypothetical protein
VSGSALSYARSPEVPRELRRLRTVDLFRELSAATDPGHFRDHGWTIRVPRRIQETQRDISRADPDLDGRDRCSNARLDNVAALVGRPRRDVSDALKARGCFTPISLDLELSPGDRTGR